MKRKTALFLVLALLVCSILVPATATSEAASQKPKLNIKKLNMTVGNNFRLRVYNLKKKYKAVYSVSDESVIKIENRASRGKYATIKAYSIGSATINVAIKKGKKVKRRLKCQIKVSPVGVSIKFLKRNITLQENARFRVKTIIKPNTSTEQPIYESDNPEVAIINSRGIITAVGPGTATITATLLSSNQTATCTVTVTEANSEDSGLSKGKKYSMAPKIIKESLS
ncbi:MAG: Ig-like domain-containing protein [Lachnospiraceae bacterium]|nr:Ig-like domain-containing protein [Lachnospiraceae bacterium]